MTEIAKTASSYENETIRRLLRDVVELEDPAGLPELQERIKNHLEGTDLRRRSRPVLSPEALAQQERDIAARQAVFGPIMRRMQGEGASLGDIARALNEAGIKTPSGGAWVRGTVKYQLDRLPVDQE